MEPLLHSGLEGETLAEGQLRTTPKDVTEFFEALKCGARSGEVGTHSAWVRESHLRLWGTKSVATRV